MILFANFMGALAEVLNVALSFVMFLIIVRAVISWFSPDPYNPLVRMLTASTDPLMRPIQRRIPALGGMDWSPIIVILVIIFLRAFVVNSLADYSIRLRNTARVPGVYESQIPLP